MKKFTAISGYSGPKIRSDCEITLELKENGGLEIDLVSKVKALYGKSIIKLASEILKFFGIENCHLRINDSGALPFVIAARLEAGIKQLINSDLEYLPELIRENTYTTSRDRFRFSRLYLPGNAPGLMINAGLHSADGIILDLEDSVAPAKKAEARILVRNALRQVNFYGAERMVRINQGGMGLLDLRYVIPHNVNLIIIPKCESADRIKQVEQEITAIKEYLNLNLNLNLINKVFLMPVIESALGVEHAFEIARSSENVVAIVMGLEDFTSDLGVARTVDGKESFYARTRLVIAAKAAGIQAIDSVFSDVGDMDGLKQTVQASKALGFDGMGCIHPRQIRVIRDGYAPDENEIERSKTIITAFENAKPDGFGVIAIGSKMIDKPVVERARRTVDIAIRLGLLSEKWMDDISVP